ncbi:MAG: hypothetical protein LBM02_06275 [Lachnospiraceae bacterium]|jgi:hypothetical protein|nr:hypothetical protein [Lachnospiraceae bacterium]
MNDNKDYIFENLLNKSILTNNVNIDKLITIGRMLGVNRNIFRGMYIAINNGQQEYRYTSFIGSDFEAKFDYKNRDVIIKRNDIDLQINYDDFILFCGLVDTAYSEILPLYTLVELDVDMFDDELKDMFNNEHKALTYLTARKIPLTNGFEKYVIDYFGRLWPFGEMPDVPPIIVSNMLIKKVITKGLSDERDEKYVENVLRKMQLDYQQISTAFMPFEAAVRYTGSLK